MGAECQMPFKKVMNIMAEIKVPHCNSYFVALLVFLV